MRNYQPFSCILIGEGSLPIQCAQLLMERGHKIVGVISSDALLAEWAAENHLPFCSSHDDLLQFLNQQPFDYLFSVVNSLILSEEILRLPKRFAINYHDSPLPKYAGLYASSWALLQGETEHAITWHVVKPGIDVGDILKQVPVEITQQDTALTLNAKCYEAAIAAFASLIDELASASISAVPQDLSDRSYYSRTKKPAIGLQFHWQRSAHELDRLVRSLNFGSFPNPLGSPMLVVGKSEVQDVVIILKLKVLDSLSQALPGTIVAIAPDALQVATSTTDVVLQKLLNLQGKLIVITELVAEFGLQVGDQLPTINLAQAQHIDRFDAQIAKHEPYWVKQLSQLQPLALPEMLRSSSPLPPSPEEFAVLHQSLPESVKRSISEQYSNFEISDIISAAFATYLARICSQTSFDLGLQDAALQADLAGIEPFFSNQIPWRIDLDMGQSPQVALAQIVQQKQQLRQRKTYSRSVVARNPVLVNKAELQGVSPFPISVHQVNSFSHWLDGAGKGIQFSPTKLQLCSLAQQLSFMVAQDEDACNWLYHTTVLNREQVEGIATQFLAYLQELLAKPDRDLVNLPLSSFHLQGMTDAERHRVLVEWNATQVEYPQHLRLHDLFEAQVEYRPEAIAVVFEGQSLTYGELNRRSNQLAHHLQQLGVEPEVCVGVCIERSLEMVVALMAILKAGGAYVPLDPTYPLDRLTHISTDAQLAVVLTQEKLLPVLPAQAVPSICLDTHWEKIATAPDVNPTSCVTARHLAYIIYTSGSTGKPKGVLIEHRGAVNTILDINRRFAVDAQDRVLAVCSLNFDLSVYDMFGLLAAGGTIVLPKPAIAPDLEDWHTLMHQEQITLWNSAPPVMQMVASHMADYKRNLPASLRLVMLSGDWIPITLPDQIRQLKLRETPVQVISLGGATEASIWSILYPIEAIDPAWKSIPYGKPMANQQFYILDEHQQPVPPGAIGELFIGGDGVARGYHNRPELNATKFLPDPFHSSPGYQIYRTGDLGRYTTDGTIEFLGRIDHQVKIRGFRIELGEIETVLSQHEVIREAAVLPREDATGAKQLVAYLVFEPEQVDSLHTNVATHLVNDIRHFLQAKLPHYMVPAAFVPIAALPLTPNGKLDRKALPEPELNVGLDESLHVAPETDDERRLVQIWEDFLGVTPIGVQDNFFELGGHSLLATRLWAQIEKEFNINLPLATLFQSPTIRELADQLQQRGAAPLCPSLVVIQRGSKVTLNPPLFCIHTLGRGLKFCRPLVSYLAPQQTVYGLSTQIAGEEFGSNDAADLAIHYSRQIQTLQPEGPYLLLGISFGGLVAHEIARHLVAQGQSVALVAALDSRMPNANQPLPMADLIAKHIYRLLDDGPRYLLQKLKDSWDGQIYDLSQWCLHTSLSLGIKLFNTVGIPLTDDMQDYLFASNNEQAQDCYSPQPYSGVVTLFKAAEEKELVSQYTDPTLGWQKYVERVEIQTVPGTHLGMLSEPNVRTLAEILQECINKSLN